MRTPIYKGMFYLNLWMSKRSTTYEVLWYIYYMVGLHNHNFSKTCDLCLLFKLSKSFVEGRIIVTTINLKYKNTHRKKEMYFKVKDRSFKMINPWEFVKSPNCVLKSCVKWTLLLCGLKSCTNRITSSSKSVRKQKSINHSLGTSTF